MFLTSVIPNIEETQHPSIVAYHGEPRVYLPVLSLPLCRQYIERTELKGIKYKILEFNPMVLRGKVKPDSSRPDLLHPVSSGFAFVHAAVQALYVPGESLKAELQFEVGEITLILFCSSTLCVSTYLCLTSTTRG